MTAADAGMRFPFLLVANRLPMDRGATSQDEKSGRPSSLAGLVTSLEPVVRTTGGAWVGWAGPLGAAQEPFDVNGVRLIPVPPSTEETERLYERFADATLWPLYHDVIVAPEFHRHWWDAYVAVNQQFADTTARHAADGAMVWVHDYHLQLVPSMLRRARPDLRIGFFNHIPFPGYEIFAQLPWRRRIVTGLLGADLIGFQRTADTTNFLRACRRAAGLTTRANVVSMVERSGQDSSTPGRVSPARPDRAQTGGRLVRVGTFPVSVDSPGIDRLARSCEVRDRAGQIRAELGNPQIVLLAVDRLDYTKGILHRLKAYEELLDAGQLGPPRAVLLQVARPSREQVEDYRILREDVEREVGRINGSHAALGQLAVHHLHRSYSREEMIALFRAADVMLVTPLRDGMNLVAKEYVACRYDESGALVLSEFTGAADELGSALLVNPHDIDGLKEKILHAAEITPVEARRRMRSMRKRVRNHDASRWVGSFLQTLRSALEP
jgi:trehalose 6-phosphate synthase